MVGSIISPVSTQKITSVSHSLIHSFIAEGSRDRLLMYSFPTLRNVPALPDSYSILEGDERDRGKERHHRPCTSSCKRIRATGFVRKGNHQHSQQRIPSLTWGG